MADFPADFAQATTPLTADMFSENDSALFDRVIAGGYEIHVGLTEAFAQDIIKMCLQPSIKEFCPNDYGKRFKDMAAIGEWLKKRRGVFLLLKREGDNLRLAGYGWVGDSTSSHVPGGQTTFAIRIGQDDQGQGLATPFSRLPIVAAAKLYGARDVWLETWQSNEGAVHVYHKVGFEDVDSEPDERPTAGGTIADVRLYMSLPNNLLAA